jgi:hypothetical protein
MSNNKSKHPNMTIIIPTYSIPDKNGQPHGFQWFTLVLIIHRSWFNIDKNIQLFPIGYFKNGRKIL